MLVVSVSQIEARQALRRYLEQQISSGQTTAHLSLDARAAVAGGLPLLPGQTATPDQVPSAPETELTSAPQTVREDPPPSPFDSPSSPNPEPASEDDKASGFGDIGLIRAATFEGNTAEEKLSSVAAQVKRSERARSLGSLREQMVFASGNPRADLMLIGDAPGTEEEAEREPLVGPSGQMLDKILKAMGLDRSELYLSNVTKFRPSTGEHQGSANRKPDPEEMRACLAFVLAEIQIVQPKVIVALGGTAAEGLLNIERATVGRMRGQFHDVEGIPLMVTYHPSFLIRSTSDPDGGMNSKRLIWEDMLLVMEQLGLPITDKQRGFFKPRS